AMLSVTWAPAAGAQFDEATCPASVDTTDEGWICSVLILGTPSSSPGDAQIDLWSRVLEQQGRQAVTDGIVFSDTSVEAKVRVIYETQLGRQPDAGGLAHWRRAVQGARTELAAEYGIFGSGEYLSQFESTEAFVADQYEYYLGREASRSEQQYWAGWFARHGLSNVGVTRSIATSGEAGATRARLLYELYARRSPDPRGLQHWATIAASSGYYPAIVDFARSPEIVATLGQLGIESAEASETS
ncbi:MAG: hypothetical protein KF703_03985, partial [Actinobacteria bacterium]|nr:hypothetical protein [Actinomycetota bacterium]